MNASEQSDLRRATGYRSRVLFVVALFALGIVLLSPFIGASFISPLALIQDSLSEVDREVLYRLRVPRSLLAFFVGAGLSVGGVAYQALFRNFLATPFTLGVAAGASFGAVLSVRFENVLPILEGGGSILFASAGALLSVVLVLCVSRSVGRASPVVMLLGGIIISYLFSGLILLIQYLSDFSQVFRMTRWLMGSLDMVDSTGLILIGAAVTTGAAIVLFTARDLDLISTGEELALTRGVDARKVRVLLFIVTSLVVGIIVSRCGIIGFVGIIVPSICRMALGPVHCWLIPACFLFGGAFLTICDTAARSLAAPAELPVGVLTALLGAPFFLDSFFSLSIRLD